MLSLIITMGFIHQDNTGDPLLGDEFDHLIGLVGAEAPFELIVVDRAWPRRWNRLSRVLGMSDVPLKYIRPKPSPFIDLGYRAVNVMRNSGAIVSEGDVLIFADDYFRMDGFSVDAIYQAWETNEDLLCPVHRPEYFPPMDHAGDQEFSGHNPGIYMSTREQFLKLGGFNENFDGAYGQADTEWQERLDRLLDTTDGYKLRKRRKGLMWRKTDHTNGIFPQPLQYPWFDRFPGIVTTPDNLRCNQAFYHLVVKPRIEAGVLDTTLPPTDREIETLRDNVCHAGCETCNRADRAYQAQSYRTMEGDHRVTYRMERFYKLVDQPLGRFDPWDGQRKRWR